MDPTRRHLLKSGAGLAALSWLPSCAQTQDPFVFEDVVVSHPKGSLVDPEFAPTGPYMAWVDRRKRLWVNDLNPNTGTWPIKNAKQTLVDEELIRVGKTR